MFFDKAALLQELRDDTWVCLRASPIHGIGVFALRSIPKGCRSFFSTGKDEWIRLSFAEVEALPAHSRELIETYCLYDEQDYFVPAQGFKIIDLTLYLNHSSSPNIVSVDDGAFYEAIEDIPAGAELLVDYGTIAAVEGYE